MTHLLTRHAGCSPTGSRPKLRATLNGEVKAKLVVTTSETTKKGLYSLKLKGDIETSGG